MHMLLHGRIHQVQRHGHCGLQVPNAQKGHVRGYAAQRHARMCLRSGWLKLCPEQHHGTVHVGKCGGYVHVASLQAARCGAFIADPYAGRRPVFSG